MKHIGDGICILTEDDHIPEPEFNFTTSDGESFSMTDIEVADLVAFVRKLKAKEDEPSA